MRTPLVEQRLTENWETSKSLSGKLSSVDPKETKVRYVVTAMVLLCARGVEALILRVQLAPPDQLILTLVIYDQIFSVRGFTMIFWCGSPIVSGFRERTRAICGTYTEMPGLALTNDPSHDITAYLHTLR